MSPRNRKSSPSNKLQAATSAAVENLEQRRMMAADAVLVGSQLQVAGTDANDTILVEKVMKAEQIISPGGAGATVWLHKVRARISNATQTIDRYFGSSQVGTINVLAHGGGDTITNNTNLSMYAQGGAGDDVIHGGSAVDSMYGEAGNDILNGNNGNDLMLGGDDNDTLDGGLGADCLFGNDGTDSANYSSRTADLVISLNVTANDGEEGEGDNVFDDIEKVQGGSGDDLITAPESGSISNTLYGGAGNDTLKGGGGNDRLYGNDDADNLYGGGGEDSLFGQEGADTLVGIGGGQSDVLQGGSSNDSFWCDSESTETITDASDYETDFGYVHRVASFARHRIVNDAGVVNEYNVSRNLLGQDLHDPDATRDDYTPTYGDYGDNPLFGDAGPQDFDIHQGALGDCYFLAGLSAAADANPASIRNAVVDLGDDTFAVRFKGAFGDTYVRVDHELPGRDNPAYAGLGHDESMWVAIMEKAFAFYRRNEGRYDGIESGEPGETFGLLGASSDYWIRNFLWLQSEDDLLNHLSTQLTAGKAVTICTLDNFNDTGSANPLVAPHCYMVEAISFTNKTVTLRNPHDSSDPMVVSAADVLEAFISVVTGNM